MTSEREKALLGELHRRAAMLRVEQADRAAAETGQDSIKLAPLPVWLIRLRHAVLAHLGMCVLVALIAPLNATGYFPWLVRLSAVLRSIFTPYATYLELSPIPQAADLVLALLYLFSPLQLVFWLSYFWVRRRIDLVPHALIRWLHGVLAGLAAVGLALHFQPGAPVRRLEKRLAQFRKPCCSRADCLPRK